MTLWVAAQWPREIALKDGGKITIYQPQPESLNGNKLSGRAAVSIKKTSKDEPIFGAVWSEGILSTDMNSRTAILESIKITRSKFPGIENEDDLKKLASLLEQEVPKWQLEITLDDINTSIARENKQAQDDFKTNPPTILYSNEASQLVLIDGKPEIKKDKDMDMEKVMNTPFLIVKAPEDRKYYLFNAGFWYRSDDVLNGYTYTTSLPKHVKSLDEQIRKQMKENSSAQPKDTKTKEEDKPVKIIVSTEPAELVQTKGEPQYKSIEGTGLLYVANTPNDLFKDINTQKNYVLLAGRWYAAATMKGSWEYIPADKLPADFAKIPEGSEKDGVLVSVAGTKAAEEAVMDAQIPQTAKVDRKTATTKVEYDGEPRFERIEGTSIELAVNTSNTVMRANGKYFAVENGIWFESTSAKGPWRVSTERPTDVDKIPPSSQAYNTKYVYIYDTTPEYVYVGYTPSYLNCYVYGPTIIYGTGWYYRPWYGSYYYPRPVTWGFGMSYNPWTGWSMNFGFSTGWFHMGFSSGGMYMGFGYSGWFGPPMYRPPYRPPYWGGGYYGGRGNNYGNVNINIGEININKGQTNNLYNRRPGVSTRDVNRRPGGSSINNSTAKPGVSTRPSTPGANTKLPQSRPTPRPSTTEKNNVISDRDGNIMRKDDKGNWSTRDNQTNQWKPADQNRVNNVQRDQMNRDRSNMRYNNYQRDVPNRSYQPSTRPSPSTRPAQRPAARPAGGIKRGR
ncbi:hypothetical protein KJS94_13020 [Flavihumibacter rivuli]|uniref:hypothetical protein n=1 Tax=Flavihumibacter rivuli TaxID=2838156 RepID=UPI001BDF3E90|nr:hypothetical protein [Flavihumibacter rivuli]ULQ55567.1 hypothetical protein KJS94_13020 [Flavihumibacter rivuli]